MKSDKVYSMNSSKPKRAELQVYEGTFPIKVMDWTKLDLKWTSNLRILHVYVSRDFIKT